MSPIPSTLPTIRLGLDAVRAVCDALGAPHLATPTVLVAGTNGKGSTAAMLEAVGRAAGLRAGLFHSPALGEDHEQVRLAGASLDRADYDDLGREVQAASARAGHEITAFETTTAIAYLAFARARLDLAVVEVGLGGAGDATNIADPVASVLTTVDFDHQRHLGPTLTAIAREKSGIFRRRRPAVLGFLRGPALREARRAAAETGARVIAARSHVRRLERAVDGRLEIATESSLYRPRLALAGEHQERNAAVAALAAEALRPRFPAIDVAAVEAGLGAANLPGRLETLVRGDRRFVLDAAHNPAASAALAGHLAAGERPDLLFGAFGDKDHRAMLEHLRPAVGRLLLTAIDHGRGWSSAALAAAAADFGGEIAPSLDAGLALARPGTPLLVTGSLRLVGDARRRLLESGARQPGSAVDDSDHGQVAGG